MKKFAWFLTLILALALVLSACAAPAPATEPPSTGEPFRVAVVLPSTINDLAFSQSIYDALVRVQKEMGGPDALELAHSENLGNPDDAAAAIRDYASKGFDLVIAHGSQYGSALQEIAPDFPETSFAWGTTADTFDQPNIFAYEAASQEGGFVNGVIAAGLTKSNVIGVVGPIETGDAKLYVDGFKAGVLSVKPDAQVNVTYIGSFGDVALAAEAATTHISNGADVLTGTAQMVVGAIGKAEESDVLWFGTQSNQASLAPSIVVASQVYVWDSTLKDMISKIKAGTLGGESLKIDLANGGEVIEFNPESRVAAEAQTLAEETIQGIIAGTIKIELPQ